MDKNDEKRGRGEEGRGGERRGAEGSRGKGGGRGMQVMRKGMG